LLECADDIIESYRNKSDPIQKFDWPKAIVCLQHALELNRGDASARGKLALCNGYVNLVRASTESPEARRASVGKAQENFQEAESLIPRAPDPHLGIARIYIYSVRNIGKAIAELHEAERLGFQPGPREMEEEADGYRFRAITELAEARKYRDKSKIMAQRDLRLAQRDFDRARQLYEPISGFSSVSVALREVDDDDHECEEMGDVLKKPPPKHPRKPTWRASHWQ
jgi:tetratricopeptide (TPR) repeat protein